MPFLGKTPSQIVDPEVDIDGGTIDGVSIGSVTANAGAFTNLTATGTLTLPDDGISGDDVNGGTISNFASTGIDDNATSTAITIDSSERTSFTSASNRPISAVSTDTNAFVTFQDTNSASVGHVKIGSETNDMVFYANAQERMRIKGGNVGIGIASPSNKLHLATTANANQFIQIDNDDTSSFFGSRSDNTTSLETNGTALLFTTGSGFIERMRINSSGNVGIGTTSPLNQLVISEGTGQHGIEFAPGTLSYIQAYDRAISDYGDLKIDAQTIQFGTDNGAERMRITSDGQVGIGTTSPNSYANYRVLTLQGTSGAEIDFENSSGTIIGAIYNSATDLTIASDFTNAVANSNITFTCDGTERMRINSLGALCVGLTNTTIGSGNVVVNEGVYVGAANGDNQIRASSAGGGSATLYIGNAAIQVSSDRRLKENIVDTSMSALEKLDQLRVVDFTWNDPSDTAVNNRNARGVWTGIIAQELVDVFPFAVNAPRNEDDLSIDEESESTWQVDQDQLVPVLIKAIQELKAEVAALKGE